MKLGFVSLVITQETGRHFTDSEYFTFIQSDIRALIPSSRSRHFLKHFFWDVTPCSLVQNILMFNRNVGIYLPNSFEIMIDSYRNQCLKSRMNVSKFIYDFGSVGEHPFVYHQIYTILVPSIHNTCKNHMFYCNWIIPSDMFRPLNGHLRANIE